jgi:solute carrier family 32 (vesicular inhibitory amino acid transporter)
LLAEFGWKRLVVRSMLMLLMVFIGETVRDFGKVLALVGGSTTTVLNMVFPPIIYLKFKSTLEPERYE